MCLDYEYKERTVNKIRKDAKHRGYIKVYKVCDYLKTGWCWCTPYKKGIQIASLVSSDPQIGWYAYLDKEEAIKFLRALLGGKECVKTCYAKPEWLKGAGWSKYNNNDTYRVGVFTKLAFPNWDKGDMTVREFKVLCKEGKE